MADYSTTGLAQAAGVDPWALQRRLAVGDPGAIQNAGLVFRRAGAMAAEAADAGRAADREVAVSFHNDGAEVFGAAASSARGAALLAGEGERMEETARALLEVAAALADAAAGTASRIDRLQADLRHIIERRNAAVAAAPLAAEAIDQRYHRMAVEAVRAAGATVKAEVDGYGAVLANCTTRVLAQGGDEPPASTDGADHELPSGEDGFPSDLADGAEVIANGVGRAAGALVEGVNRAGGAIGGAVGGAPSEIVDGFADGDPLDGLGDAVDELYVGLGEAEDEIGAGVDRAGEQIGDAVGEAVGHNPDAEGEADRNGVWGQTTGPTPPPDQIEVTRRSHVAYGDSDGGGHIHDSGVPNKTTFPPGWDDDRIIREVRDVARNPDPRSEPVFDEDRGAWRVEGVRDGVRIRSYVTEQGDVTGHPLGGPGVHRNDENGDPQPLQ